MSNDPRHRTAEGFIAGLAILAQYMEDGLRQKYFCGGEHDIIHIYVGTDKLPEDSADGKVLLTLGFGVNDDGWSFVT